jgi:hypothetical protein
MSISNNSYNTIRKSLRISSKPTVNYDLSNQDELIDIAYIIETICIKKGLKYTDNLIDEFSSWLLTVDHRELEKFSSKTNSYIPMNILEKAKYWALFCSVSLQKQQMIINLENNIKKYCYKNNMEYESNMVMLFYTWFTDPKNNNIIKYIPPYKECDCNMCDGSNNKSSYNHSIPYCINIWVKTFNIQ